MTVVATFILRGFSWQHCDFGACLLDELLQVNLPQLLGQLLQLVLHVLQRNSEKEKVIPQETVEHYQQLKTDSCRLRLYETVFEYF